MKHNLGLTGRILITFWLTLLLVVSAMALIFFSDRDDNNQHKIPNIALMDELNTKLISTSYQNASRWFKQQDKHDRKRIFVMFKGQEILHRTLPRHLKYIKRRLSTSQPFISRHIYGHLFIGRLLLLPDGQHIKVFIRDKSGHPPLHKIVTENLAAVVLSALLISGLISYVLARFISKPILLLRQATQNFASGNLSSRVLPKLKKRQDEVYLLAQDFDFMAEKLQTSISSHKHLIQDISHELRSPVARLQLALELTKKHLNIPDDQKDILRIEKECEQLNSIINTLLNLPAFELDPALALQDSVDIEAFLEDVCEDINFTRDTQPIQFISSLQQPLILTANHQLLCSAIVNILKNAQHYHASDDPITLTLRPCDKNLIIECCDAGPGIDDDKLTDIFKPFYRLDQARDRASGGHGLGLAISKRAIELHEGSIKANNRSPTGLCICITLPLTLATTY
jgi:two-component system sensor histidine kinase CpxA